MKDNAINTKIENILERLDKIEERLRKIESYNTLDSELARKVLNKYMV